MALIVRLNQPSFRDQRANLGIPEDQIIPFTYELGFHPSFAPMKKYWDEGKLVVLLGIGYPNPSLSHFRSMDIWATCEPDTMGRAPEGEWMWWKESTYIHLPICWEGGSGWDQDALAADGVPHMDTPLTPDKIWRALRSQDI